ncbi:MAG: hypothetical protein IPM51_00565 [Sphingobacteriaceae bacterium]|nr:hypothetical protein [Sphingobacteriaceae bacterium]
MNPIVRNIIAVIIGVLAGGSLNMGIIMISGKIIPPPHGADVTTMEGLVASMHLFEPKHFLMPFLAHALGSFAGAAIAALIAATHKMKFAISIGCWYLLGGTINVFMLPSPTWFNITDLALAYIPMAFIAGKLFIKNNKQTN